MECEVRTPDVPYGDYFYLLERWTIGSTSSTANKCYLKIYISVQIVKKTVFEKKIQKRAIEEYTALMKNWLEIVNKKKLTTMPQKKKAMEDNLFDHEVEEVEAKRKASSRRSSGSEDENQPDETGTFAVKFSLYLIISIYR